MTTRTCSARRALLGSQLGPESDETKQFPAAIFGRTFDNIAPLAASQAFRSDRHASGADRNSRASLLAGCYGPSATPFAFLTANGSVSLPERSWGPRQDPTSGTSA